MQNQTLFIVFSFLLLSPCYVAAQDSFKGNSGEPFTPSTIIIIIMAIIFLFTGCLAVFLRRFSEGCFGLHVIPINYPDSTPEAAKGLDADVIKSLPTYLYADVKQHRKVGQVELECAVCLYEFQDKDTLRLLPGCSHVFHPRCIDRWLTGHVTCPVCRQSLLQPAAESGDKQLPHSIINITEVVARQEGSSSDDDNQVEETMMMNHEDAEGLKKTINVGKFSRSHSTGHSIRIMGSAEKYTLVLPTEYQAQNQVHKNNTANERSKKGLLSTCMVSPRSGYKCGWFPMTPPPLKTSNSGSRSVRTLVSSSLFKSSSFKNLTIPDSGGRQLA